MMAVAVLRGPPNAQAASVSPSLRGLQVLQDGTAVVAGSEEGQVRSCWSTGQQGVQKRLERSSPRTESRSAHRVCPPRRGAPWRAARSLLAASGRVALRCMAGTTLRSDGRLLGTQRLRGAPGVLGTTGTPLPEARGCSGLASPTLASTERGGPARAGAGVGHARRARAGAAAGRERAGAPPAAGVLPPGRRARPRARPGGPDRRARQRCARAAGRPARRPPHRLRAGQRLGRCAPRAGRLRGPAASRQCARAGRLRGSGSCTTPGPHPLPCKRACTHPACTHPATPSACDGAGVGLTRSNPTNTPCRNPQDVDLGHSAGRCTTRMSASDWAVCKGVPCIGGGFWAQGWWTSRGRRSRMPSAQRARTPATAPQGPPGRLAAGLSAAAQSPTG